MKQHAMSRLQEQAATKGPLCVGLDTDPSYIPASVVRDFSSPADAVLSYNLAIIARLGASACCCKVQIAYYEAMGIAGLRAYSETLRAVRNAGYSVIADVKRGDIADTASAYARAHFSGDFEADIITLNPYMGFDTLVPFTAWAKPENGGKGMFVLLRTSNSGMTDIEKLPLVPAPGKTDTEFVLDKVGAELLRLASEFAPLYPPTDELSPIGAVVGCTEESDARKIRDRYRNLFFLIPGYGAQGGQAKIAATLLDRAGGTVNSSRGILTAWKKSASLAQKAEDGTITLNEIADAAAEAAFAAKADLIAAKAALTKDGQHGA